MAYEPRDFHGDQLREAVEYLKSIPDAKYVGLSAFAETVKAGSSLLGPQVFLKLDNILGRMPAQVWAQFDAEIDRQVYGSD
jgi:hypothetical protein